MPNMQIWQTCYLLKSIFGLGWNFLRNSCPFPQGCLLLLCCPQRRTWRKMCCCRKTFKSVGQCKHLNHLVDSSEKREHLSRLPSSAADGRISHRTVIQSHHCRQECLWQCEMPRDKNSMAVKEIIVYKRCVKICALFSQPLFNLLKTHCRDGLKVNFRSQS